MNTDFNQNYLVANVAFLLMLVPAGFAQTPETLSLTHRCKQRSRPFHL
jgi:hypothetical protein